MLVRLFRFVKKRDTNLSFQITGESGAGRTENAKKVITYFAILGASEGKKKMDGDPPEE